MQTLNRILFLIAVFLIYCLVVHGDGKRHVPVTIIRIDSDKVISEEEIRNDYDDLNVLLLPIDVDFQIKSIIEEKDPSPELNTKELVNRKIESLYYYSRDNNLLDSTSMLHWIIPAPTNTIDNEYLYGISSQICSLDKLNINISTGSVVNKTLSGLIIDHESAHYLGATHHNIMNNIMNENALSFKNENLNFTTRSLIEMLDCVENSTIHK